MLGPSWVRWQLLFGWALLVGQLICGVEGCCERQEPPPEDGCCEHHERPREGGCCVHQQQPVEQGRCNEEPSPSEEWDDTYFLPEDSTEYAEFVAKAGRRQMEEAQAYDPIVVPEHFKWMAVSHYNDHSHGPYYRHLEDTHLKVKKAIGTMAYLHLFLEKTGCIRDRQRDRHITYTNEYLDALVCGLPPETEREKVDCTFAIFMDARSGRQAVVSEHCTHLQNSEE